jgi:hypothetical protein
MLLSYANVHKKTPAWVKACFKEICLVWPRWSDPQAPADFYIIEEWLAARR